jgi:hypothetical protein
MLRIEDNPTLNDVIEFLDTGQDDPDLSQYGCFHSVVRLIMRYQCTDIVELHSPHKRISTALCSAFEDVNVTTICKEHEPLHNHDNLNCIQDWSSNALDEVEDESLDLVFIHDHDHPDDEIYDTLRNWLRKIKPGGIMCGHHWGLESDSMSSRAYSLYEFARKENLVIDSEGTNTFVCINTPMDAEVQLLPIRLEELND